MPSIDIQTLLIRVLVLSFSLSTHEFAHAAAAYRLGDNTAKELGRLTLNPKAHLDPMGTLAFIIAGIGWAKPVPINPQNFSKAKSAKQGTMLVSLAGPVSNLLISFVAAFGYNLVQVIYAYLLLVKGVRQGNPLLLTEIFEKIFLSFYFANIGLAIFNLLPIPPLDGSKVLAPLIPDKIHNWMVKNQQYISLIVLALFLFASDVLSNIITTIAVPFNYVLMKPWTELADLIVKRFILRI